ncbi:MAG: DoxX family protein [Brevinematia bacterium]
MADLGILILRIVSGITMALFHGWGKLLGIINFLSGKEWKFVDKVANLGLPLPGLFAILTGLIEFLCSILLLLGLFTRINALLLTSVMIVALYYNIRSGNPYELTLLYLAIFISLLILGGGKYSLDHLLYKKGKS